MARGGGARDQFVFQKRYEKIIQNLLDQRAAASSARGNALANAARGLLANFTSSQPYTREQMGSFVMADMINQVVPPAQQNIAYAAMGKMRQNGIVDWDIFRQSLHVYEEQQDGSIKDMGWGNAVDQQMWEALLPYADLIESAVNRSTQRRIDELYNEMFDDPQTIFDQFNVGREEGFNAGLNFNDATAYANTQLLGDQSDFTDLGALLDELGLSEYQGLFGQGLG
jgi:uncharacterized glyoxalase superfamily metalloenzyme YdcJ